ncbi:MAG: response regulator [ANME-2 cluster archaeon]|nr:response regulator [ANME-2 cluster archaeon]
MVHLFVAEDTKLIRRVIKTIVEEHASEVIESADGPGAVKEIGNDGSKITFLDIYMPDEKGLNAVYDIINSIPEAKIDLYKTDLKEHIKEPMSETATTTSPEVKVDAKSVPQSSSQFVVKKDEMYDTLHHGLKAAVQSITVMMNRNVEYKIIKEDTVKKDNLNPFIPRACLGVFNKFSGDVEGGGGLMFPLKDILATVGVFQIDFTVEEGTTQNIINELGNVFINGILGVLEKEMQKKFSLGAPMPASGDNIEKHFNDVGRGNDECVIIKLQFLVDEKTIDAYLLFSTGRIIN